MANVDMIKRNDKKYENMKCVFRVNFKNMVNQW